MGRVDKSPHTALSGVLIVDKPPGMTSMTAVAAVRRKAGRVKTGHEPLCSFRCGKSERPFHTLDFPHRGAPIVLREQEVCTCTVEVCVSRRVVMGVPECVLDGIDTSIRFALHHGMIGKIRENGKPILIPLFLSVQRAR